CSSDLHGLGKGGNGGSAASFGKGGGANNGSGGTIPVGGVSGNTGKGGGSSGTLNGDTACVADERNGNRAIVALYFMVDISGSMNCHIPEVDPPCTSDPNDTFATTRWTEASP